MAVTSSTRSAVWIVLVGVITPLTAIGQQVAGIQSATQRVFVTGVTPVIGPRGFVGGVAVDAEGVVRRPAIEDRVALARSRAAALQRQPDDLNRPAKMRMISLKELDRAIGKLVLEGKSPSESMFFLAGLQRVEYVFADPDHDDLILAGPAEGWKLNDAGQIVGQTTGSPVLRLDDLMEAFRTVDAARDEGISCSIEPTAAGLRRYAQWIKTRRTRFGPDAVQAIERAMGPQQVLITGVEADSHYARVMVAADFVMKRIAMGWEPSRLDELPSYLDLLRRKPPTRQIASPRWWMTVDYEPVRHSPDRLAWQIRGQGLKTMTEDSFLAEDGQRQVADQTNPIAQRWADSMTEHLEPLAGQFPVFGQLRNCVDLSVVAAIITKRDLLSVSHCELDYLLDRSKIRGPIYDAPQRVDSKASFVRARRGWIVSVSGGVDVDAWGVADRTAMDDKLEQTRRRAVTRQDRWWW